MGFEPRLGGIKEVRALSHAKVGEMEVRATKEASRAQVKEDGGVACFLGGDCRDSESFSVKARARMTEEALTAEASRYESIPAVFGGDRVLFSSSPLLGVIGLWCPWVTGIEGEKYMGNRPQENENLQEREDSGSSWDESSLAKFSKSLGFTTEGVEGEILKLLFKIENQKGSRQEEGNFRNV
ncbi:hypothetical protein CK203_061584 [Vitis vinifera]|uniref:Uncharacterized protein n=1 Tax=Vitis vinifera TaxID=29760 RepID=A0A438G9J3_VITVI|nr:hypothetical protein CK203_061584 [Vitis vinifera]